MNKHPAAILIVPVAVALVVTLFAWPNAKLEPRDLPIGVAGPEPAAQGIERKLAAQEGAFDSERFADEAAARQAIEDRDVYGAFVVAPTGAKVLTASAASPAVTQLLDRAAEEAGARTENVVSTPAAGSALASSVLPLVLAGLLTGALAVALGSTGPARAGLLVVAAVLGGLVVVAIVQCWLDVVEGSWVANAAVFSLTILAIAATVAGLQALLGERGLGIGVLLMVLIGNPFSAAATAPELLPRPVGGIGQLMPPGAGANLARSTGFFDGAGAGGHVLVLAVWALGGLALLFAASARSRRAQPGLGSPIQ